MLHELLAVIAGGVAGFAIGEYLERKRAEEERIELMQELHFTQMRTHGANVMYRDEPMNRWAAAIAHRLADEAQELDEEEKQVLEEVLTKALERVPYELPKIIGTGVIEEDFFDPM